MNRSNNVQETTPPQNSCFYSEQVDPRSVWTQVITGVQTPQGEIVKAINQLELLATEPCLITNKLGRLI